MFKILVNKNFTELHIVLLRYGFNDFAILAFFYVSRLTSNKEYEIHQLLVY